MIRLGFAALRSRERLGLAPEHVLEPEKLL